MSHRSDLSSTILRQEGWLACSLLDPAEPASNNSPLTGLVVACKVRALASAACTHVIFGVATGPTNLTLALTDVCDITGAQLSLSTDKSAVAGVGGFADLGDKAIVVPSFNLVEGAEYFIRQLFTLSSGTASPLLVCASKQRGANAPRLQLGLGAPYRFMQSPAAGQTTLASFDPTTYVSTGAAYLMGLAA